MYSRGEVTVQQQSITYTLRRIFFYFDWLSSFAVVNSYQFVLHKCQVRLVRVRFENVCNRVILPRSNKRVCNNSISTVVDSHTNDTHRLVGKILLWKSDYLLKVIISERIFNYGKKKKKWSRIFTKTQNVF